MADPKMLEAFLARADVDEEVFALPPGYRVKLQTDDTTAALFTLDALRAATNDLAAHLTQLGLDDCVTCSMTVTDTTSQSRDGA